MTLQAKYLEALKALGDWVTVSEWAIKVGEMYPDVLANADRQAANQTQDTTGLREIGARLSSRTSKGRFKERVEVDTSERPRKVRYVSDDEVENHVAEEVEEDAAPLRRAEIEKRDFQKLGPLEKYRLEELQAIARQLKSFYGLDFELDHAAALLNPDAPGAHHPDNIQFLLKLHNGKKHYSNWPRFSLEEQVGYIKSAVELQKYVMDRLDIDGQTQVLDSLIDRISRVYECST